MNRRALTRAQLIFLALMSGAAIIVATLLAGSPASTLAALHNDTPTISALTASDPGASEEPPAESVGAQASPAPTAIQPSGAPPVTAPPLTRPPITANEYFPEDRNVTDCIGAFERPGCGNKNRGGWGQYAVAGALALGMAVIFGNIVRGVRRNERSKNPE